MRTVFLLLLLVAAGCDSTGVIEPPSPGQFYGSVSGARELRLDGRALFSVDPDLESWGLILAGGPTHVVSAGVNRAAPTVGTIRIPDTALASMSEFSGSAGVSFQATDGLLRIEDVTDDVVRGDMVFEGESKTGERVSVEATFAASRLAVPEIPTATPLVMRQ